MSLNKDKVTASLDKKAAYGEDLNLASYDDSDLDRIKNIDELSVAGKKKLERIGIELDEEGRSATFVQVDNAAVKVNVKKDTL